MTDRFANKVALITGGASGIGLATAQTLLENGASVLIADLNSKAIDTAREKLEALHFDGKAVFEQSDVADEAAVRHCVARAVAEFGHLDIAFLNAGVGGAFGGIEETSVAHWDETFALLVRSVFLGIKYCSKQMHAGGNIVVTSSVAGLSGGGAGHAYSAAKAAVINLVTSAATELAARGIRINSVAPGLISTPLVHGGDEARMPPLAGRHLLADYGQPQHIADTVAFLASDEAAFITGETIVVDGGLRANGSRIWRDNLFVGKSGMNRGSTGLGATVNPLASDDQ